MSKLKILYVNSPKYDLITALHIEGLLKCEDADVRFTSLGNYAPRQYVLDYHDAVLYGEKEADILVMGSRYVRDLSLKQAQSILENRQTDPLLVMQARDVELFWKIKSKRLLRVKMDGGDSAALGINVSDYFKYDLIFKRELYISSWSLSALKYSLIGGQAGLWESLKAHRLIPFPNYHSMGNTAPFFIQARNVLRNLAWSFFSDHVLPLPLGMEDRVLGVVNNNPEYDICCIMRIHNSERLQIFKILEKLHFLRVLLDNNSPSTTDEDVMWMKNKGAAHPYAVKYGGLGFARNSDYLKKLNSCRASISIPGGGFDTLRLWEILAQGSLLISKRISLKMPAPLQEGIHYMAFDTLDELEEIFGWLQKYPEEADKIRIAGYQYAREHHTSLARAKYFVNTINNMINKDGITND